MASETINFGQIFAVAVVGFLLYRWFSGPALPSSTSSGRNGGRQVNPEHVEAVAQMYPQLDRRAIIWDLHRNGGSVQATVERLLGGRSLETPPPSFQPPIPRAAAPPTPSRPVVVNKPAPNLIARYNLSSRLAPQESTQESEASGASTGTKGWSQNKTERSEILKRRREEMVLAARRKMQEKDQTKAA
ncbi:AMFR protein-like protein [Aureobasidium pullulans]|uniref:Coupling of ubiquitin conjugation to ER degradation protein 1 n=2 Tax=Aureobasidium pullulans TaxID=5580 RepID=A0A074XEC7_AURPU|nr:AMFR protein-like protein [Aureobasidium pullulans EXF-150]THV75725.1 AMFR protein-like protein [Aureobasidium pullulans]KEQ83865.1 AMFR protein-like protein [Aureobasidium pullulans EXF-150]THV80943.1 AMFR protein-like protein [Aureobasidium pullulans]THW42807.1 AMFR protein-like protein [Aureobasidium pullulans]THW50216.1 AMFR protein-like protein [Aureobasidium pullulans]